MNSLKNNIINKANNNHLNVSCIPNLRIPNNQVCYFAFYYDYYQPDAYVSSINTYIYINNETNRLSHYDASLVINTKDVIVFMPIFLAII